MFHTLGWWARVAPFAAFVFFSLTAHSINLTQIPVPPYFTTGQRVATVYLPKSLAPSYLPSKNWASIKPVLLRNSTSGNCRDSLMEIRAALAAEIDQILLDNGMALPGHLENWTPEFWEILWEVLKETVPELIPGLDTAIEFKNAIEAASKGNWWLSSWHIAGAILTLTPWDKIKDSYKLAKAVGRGTRWFGLVKRCSGYNDEMAQGLRNILCKEIKNPHIFREAPGHLPDLQPAISAAGGADNLLFDVYKKISDDGLAAGMAIGEIRTADFKLHGILLRARFIRHTINGVNKIELSDFWKM